MQARGVVGAELLAERGHDGAERRVHVVVVPADDLRLDERVGRQLPLLGILEELSRGEEVGGEVAGEPRGVDDAGQRVVRWRVAVDLPRQPGRVEPVKQRLRVVVTRERPRRRGVHHKARRRPSVEEGAVGIGARRHVAEPVVERRKTARDRRQDRHLLRRVAGHDLRVLLDRRLTPKLGGQHADVVGQETVHRRRLAVARLVEGLVRLQLEAVLLIENPEQLRVDVRKLLTRIGTRRVHVRRHPVGDDPVLRPVLRPIRDPV